MTRHDARGPVGDATFGRFIWCRCSTLMPTPRWHFDVEPFFESDIRPRSVESSVAAARKASHRSQGISPLMGRASRKKKKKKALSDCR